MEEINSVTESVISNWFHERLLQWGVSEGLAVYLNLLGLLFALTVIVIVVAYLTRKILVEAVSRIASKTNSRFDDFLVGNRTMAYVARIIPLIIIVQTIPIVLADFPGLLGPVKKAADVYLVFLWLWIIRALLRSIRD